MTEPKPVKKLVGYKRWIAIFAILALLIHGGVFYLFTLNLQEPRAREVDTGFVFLQPDDQALSNDALEEQAFLFDSEPIFLPTARNYSGPIKTDASVWEPEVSLAASFPAEIQWDDSLLLIDPGIEPGGGDSLELLEEVSRDFVSAFSAVTTDDPAETVPGLYVEAKNSRGDLVFKRFIALENASRLDFPVNPAEFSVLHTNYGLAGMPLLISPSGNEETDNVARRFILDKVNVLLAGKTGYFHLRIGL